MARMVLGVLVFGGVLGMGCVSGGPGERVSVMTFNIWVGGESGGEPLERTAEVIRASGADVVGMQEAYGRRRNGERPDNGAKVAAMLGWHHVDQGGGRAILSRFAIVGLTGDRQGAELRLPSGRALYVFNVHFHHAPYQPYQLLGIEYADAPFLETEGELIAAAHEARGHEVEALLAELRPLVDGGAAVVLTGDFNEPSHEDWTARAVSAGVVPMAVAYPATQRVIGAGMVDAYRAVYPDEVRHRGLTWTPITAEDDPADRHDRIDFVFVSEGIRVAACRLVGESERYADVVVRPYPSDHRAVVAEVILP